MGVSRETLEPNFSWGGLIISATQHYAQVMLTTVQKLKPFIKNGH